MVYFAHLRERYDLRGFGVSREVTLRICRHYLIFVGLEFVPV
jgi:hypothetical protein